MKQIFLLFLLGAGLMGPLWAVSPSPAVAAASAAAVSNSQPASSVSAKPSLRTRWQRAKQRFSQRITLGQRAQDDEANTWSIVGLALGAIGLGFLFVLPPISLLFGIGGWICGAVARKRGEDETLARIALIGGVVMAIVGLLITGLFVLLLATL
jgi:hypothetical protein